MSAAARARGRGRGRGRPRRRRGLASRIWRGRLPIGALFWGYGAAIGLPLNILCSAAMYALLSADRPIAALFVGHAIAVPYTALVAVGLWRAAGRLASPTERVLLRAASAIGAALLILT